VALALVPIPLLVAVLVARPLISQEAPSSPLPRTEVVSEVVSDAPVCVRFYPETGETREGAEICATRPGDPPPPVPPVVPVGTPPG
jgi:hypothetical protein